MNYRVIPARRICNKCNNITDISAEHCNGCGTSFVFGQPDVWKSTPLTSGETNLEHENAFGIKESDIPKIFSDLEKAILDKINKNRMNYSEPMQKCLHDGVKPGTVMSISCPCPKCTVMC